jgi:hypothetical protein
LCPPVWRHSECIYLVQSKHLKQFVVNGSGDNQRDRFLRSLEVGIGNKTQPDLFRDSTDNDFLLRMVMPEKELEFVYCWGWGGGKDLLSRIHAGGERGHGAARPKA